jgi:cell wall-associated NlpC family hydrolase
MSVDQVQARISQIQGQLALLTPASTSASSAAFAATLSTQQVTGATATGSASTGTTGEDVVTEAKKYLGVPYVWGGTDPKRGLDCSGMIQLVYKNLGYDIPRVSYEQATAGTEVKGGLAAAKPGDILAFGSPVHHVGIYIGDNKMIEAPRPGLDVRIGEVYETPTAIRRIIPEGGTAMGSTVGAMSGTTSKVPSGTPYADLFQASAAKYGLDPNLLVAVARQESGFNAKAVSPAGAQGIMQLMPGTAAGLGVSNSFDPSQAIDGAAKLLKSLIGEFGRTDLALAGYNAGPGAVHRYGGIPPYPETQNYVRSIMAMLHGS